MKIAEILQRYILSLAVNFHPYKEYQTIIQDLSTALAGYKTIIENNTQQMAGIGQAIANAD